MRAPRPPPSPPRTIITHAELPTTSKPLSILISSDSNFALERIKRGATRRDAETCLSRLSVCLPARLSFSPRASPFLLVVPLSALCRLAVPKLSVDCCSSLVTQKRLRCRRAEITFFGTPRVTERLEFEFTSSV